MWARAERSHLIGSTVEAEPVPRLSWVRWAASAAVLLIAAGLCGVIAMVLQHDDFEDRVERLSHMEPTVEVARDTKDLPGVKYDLDKKTELSAATDDFPFKDRAEETPVASVTETSAAVVPAERLPAPPIDSYSSFGIAETPAERLPESPADLGVALARVAPPAAVESAPPAAAVKLLARSPQPMTKAEEVAVAPELAAKPKTNEPATLFLMEERYKKTLADSEAKVIPPPIEAARADKAPRKLKYSDTIVLADGAPANNEILFTNDLAATTSEVAAILQRELG